MHWAAHGKTAAEIIYDRVDASQPNMGMTNWDGKKIRKNQTEIAKNYLAEDELNVLNRIVTMYLEFAELQALGRKPMTMQDWITKLDDFLKLSGREILQNAGKISRKVALDKAHEEYEKFNQLQVNQVSEVEKRFLEAEHKLKELSK